MVNKNCEGQTALPMVLLISLVLIELAVMNVFVSSLVSDTLRNKKFQLEAEKMAYTGINDAFIKITRDKNLAITPLSYNLNLNNFNIEVEIKGDFLNNLYYVTSTAKSLIFNYQKRYIGILGVEKESGKIKLVSIEEKPVE